MEIPGIVILIWMVALKGPKIIVQPISSCKHHFMVCGTDRCQSSIWQFGLPGTGPIIIKWFECFCDLPVITIVWFCSRNKTSLSSLTGWNASQITEHLHNCIQLSRDNVSVAWFEILTCVNWTCQHWIYLFMYWKFQMMLIQHSVKIRLAFQHAVKSTSNLVDTGK